MIYYTLNVLAMPKLDRDWFIMQIPKYNNICKCDPEDGTARHGAARRRGVNSIKIKCITTLVCNEYNEQFIKRVCVSL